MRYNGIIRALLFSAFRINRTKESRPKSRHAVQGTFVDGGEGYWFVLCEFMSIKSRGDDVKSDGQTSGDCT
jgi:hypothetical protein